MMGLDSGRRFFDNETSKPKNLWATLGRFGSYFKRYWYSLLFVFVLVIINTWAQVFAPEVIGQAVDCYLFSPQSFGPVAQFMPDAGSSPLESSCWLVEEDATAIAARVQADASIPQTDKQAIINGAIISGLAQTVLLLLGLYAMTAVLQGLSFYWMARTGQNVLRQMRKELFLQMNRLSMGYYARNEAGDVMSRITNDTDTIQQIIQFGLLSVISGFLLILWISYKMLELNLIYGLISLAVVPVIILTTMILSRQARRAFRVSRREIGSLNADLQEGISGAREVQAFNREDENIEQFMVTNAANRDANIRAAAYTSALNPALEALGYVALGIVVLAGGYSLLRGEPLLGIGSVVTIGLVITFLQYVQRFNQPITQIAVLWTNIQSAIAGGERIFDLLDIEPDIVDKPDARKMPQITGRVTFEDVCAEYETGKPILKGVSFTAEPGQMVAIVGPTGAGKTTIINLISRFYDVTQGAVMIDGIDVRDVTVDSLRSQIGIVLQDSFLFSDTVLNNIRYGRLTATDDEVVEAAKMIAADPFITRLPQGYQTILGERGGGLSQGQRQLIAIARAALLDPRILILDEATSSVDTRTERIIQSALERLLDGRTSFVIAHRLSTIRNADQVLVVQDGRIVEHGTHDTLLAQNGVYYDLYMSQFRHEGTTNDAGERKAAPHMND